MADEQVIQLPRSLCDFSKSGSEQVLPEPPFDGDRGVGFEQPRVFHLR